MTHMGCIVYSWPTVVPLDMPPVARDKLGLQTTTRHHPPTPQMPVSPWSPYGLTFVRVRELCTFSVGSSPEARGGDQAGCSAEEDEDMRDAFLDDKKLGLDVTRLGLRRGTVMIHFRGDAGFGLGRMKII